MLRGVLFSVLASCFLLAGRASGGDRLIVHEWGTFTSLEDEAGKPIGGINTDDEPLPDFVHDLRRMIAGPSEMPAILFKGVPRCDPDVLVRLETPVIYFQLPANGPKSLKLDLDVTLHGGWLTQYYPDAQVWAPGLEQINDDGSYGKLDAKSDGSLAWRGLTIGTNNAGPQTTAPVWLAPRAVNAAAVTTPAGESERFLFYRGVGSFTPPVAVKWLGATLSVESNDAAMMEDVWLVDVAADGRCAMRVVNTGPTTARYVQLSSTFRPEDYAAENLTKIRTLLRKAMLQRGLFSDEADALLNTWEASYFRRPGLRLFFMVPSAWCDKVLPLHLSVDAEIKRVMIGRIEIVTPQQRDLLSLVAKGPASSPGTWLNAALKQANGGREDYYREEWYQRVMNGEAGLQSMHVDMPADYRAYLQLGRFRNALILDEAARRPSAALSAFIKNYELEASGRGS